MAGRLPFVRDPVPVVRGRLPGPDEPPKVVRDKPLEEVVAVFVHCLGVAAGGGETGLRLEGGIVVYAPAALPAKRKTYTHPILDEGSAERQWPASLGIEVGRAGLEVAG